MFKIMELEFEKCLVLYSLAAVLALAICHIDAPARAGMTIYPAKGQSAEQQKKDEFECHQWAVKQSGFDPAAVSKAPQYQQASKRGGVLKGGARGALVGAGIGAIAGDAGKGAAIGAVAGGAGGGIRQRRQNRRTDEANQQTAQDYQAGLNAYNKAKALCLEGKGYKVGN